MNKKYITSLTALFLLFTTMVIAQDITIDANAEYKYDGTKTKVLSINFVAFTSSEADEYAFVFNTFSQPYMFFRGGIGNFGYANAPVTLPDGATITKFTYWAYDNDAGEFSRLRLYRTPFGGNPVQLAEVETTSESASVQEISTNLNHVVDNINNTYFMRYNGSNNDTDTIRLYGVQIEYTVDKVE